METERLQKRLEELRSLVDSSKRLKEVFDSNWFEGARESISNADESVTMKTHTAFIGYLQDALLEPDRPNLLRHVDDALDQISAAARRALFLNGNDALRLCAHGHEYFHMTRMPSQTCAASKCTVLLSYSRILRRRPRFKGRSVKPTGYRRSAFGIVVILTTKTRRR
jgi:hypothetical protein